MTITYSSFEVVFRFALISQIHFQGVSCTTLTNKLINELLHTCHKFKCKHLYLELHRTEVQCL